MVREVAYQAAPVFCLDPCARLEGAGMRVDIFTLQIRTAERRRTCAQLKMLRILHGCRLSSCLISGVVCRNSTVYVATRAERGENINKPWIWSQQ